ncbi:prepilin peptidase [Salmonella enterica]|nr:prepilin peptidase [Salmonella enterica]
MLLFFLVITYLIPEITPYLYRDKRNDAIQQSIELSKECDTVSKSLFLSAIIFSCSAVIFYMSGDFYLLIFMTLLAVVAYTDLFTRWVPDPLIYLLLACSVYVASQYDVAIHLWAMFFYIMPAILLNLTFRIYKKKYVIASGDFYVFPAIGLMLAPEHAAIVMFLNLVFILFISPFFTSIPLITVSFFSFAGYQLCLLLGLF